MSQDILQLLPHRPPVLLVDRLLESDQRHAVAEKVFGAEGFGVWSGRVLGSALMEGLAQTTAALFGAAAGASGASPGQSGMLVGLTDFRFPDMAAAGKRVEYHVEILRTLGPFCFVAGRAECDGRVVAQGELRVVRMEDPLAKT
jgi:3-hydroxyacyl-[acyl-carrier-protein] dehydratase